MLTENPIKTPVEIPRESRVTAWQVIRLALVVWSFGVWVLLILMPAIELIVDVNALIHHLPPVLLSAALLGGIYLTCQTGANGLMLWFVCVLLMIAGWV